MLDAPILRGAIGISQIELERGGLSRFLTWRSCGSSVTSRKPFFIVLALPCSLKALRSGASTNSRELYFILQFSPSGHF